MLLGLLLQTLGISAWTSREDDLKLAHQGGPADLGMYLDTLRREALHTICLLSGDLAEAAEDICQEAYVSLMANEASSFRNFRGQCSLKTFVLNAVRYKALDHWRAKRRRPDETPSEELDLAVPVAADPAQTVVRQELQRVVHEAIEGLEPRQRQVIRLHCFAGLTCREIGEMIGLSRGRVACMLVDARAQLGVALRDFE